MNCPNCGQSLDGQIALHELKCYSCGFLFRYDDIIVVGSQPEKTLLPLQSFVHSEEEKLKKRLEEQARQDLEEQMRRKREAEAEARRKREAEAEARRKREAEAEARRKREAEAEARRKREAEAEAIRQDRSAAGDFSRMVRDIVGMGAVQYTKDFGKRIDDALSLYKSLTDDQTELVSKDYWSLLHINSEYIALKNEFKERKQARKKKIRILASWAINISVAVLLMNIFVVPAWYEWFVAHCGDGLLFFHSDIALALTLLLFCSTNTIAGIVDEEFKLSKQGTIGVLLVLIPALISFFLSVLVSLFPSIGFSLYERVSESALSTSFVNIECVGLILQNLNEFEKLTNDYLDRHEWREKAVRVFDLFSWMLMCSLFFSFLARMYVLLKK